MRDEDILRYIELAKKKIPHFLKKYQGKVVLTFDDIEAEVMFSIIQYYDTIKNFELENPDEIERYLFGVVKNVTLGLIKKEAKHQQNRVKVNCGESAAENDEIEENKFFVDNRIPENIKEDNEDVVKQLNTFCENLNILKNLIHKTNYTKIKKINKRNQSYSLISPKINCVKNLIIATQYKSLANDIRYNRKKIKIKKGKINDKRFFTSFGLK